MNKTFNTDNYFNEIGLDEAIIMHRNGSEFYLLYPDNTEALYEGQIDLQSHYNYGGGFGTE